MLAAQVVIFFVAAKVAYRLWPDGTTLSESAQKLVPVFVGAALFATIMILLGQWSIGEYIAMPLPTIALILMIPRTRHWLSRILSPNRHDNHGAHRPDPK